MRKSTALYLIAFVILIFIVAGRVVQISPAFYLNKWLKKDKIPNVIKENGLEADASTKAELKEQKNNEIYSQRRNSITEAVQNIEPSVVSINIIKTEVYRRSLNPFDNPFFGFFDIPYKRPVEAIGSGVIFTQDGYILSNAHVVEGATQIKVILSDGRDFEGKIVGMDTVHDIAVIKIEGSELPSAKLGTSKDLIIGEWSIAVGNPYGFLIKDSKPSVSVGVISAIDRNFAEQQKGKIYKRMIQTDAAINPGNSGGPLVNIFGEVIGLNTFIFSESGGSVGIGFATPIDRVKKIARELIEFGRIRKRWFGFLVQDLNPMIANYLKLENLNGVIVSSVDKNGPAARAGLKNGDVITKINSTKITSSEEAEMAVSDLAIGEEVNITVIRGKKTKTFKMTTEEY